MGISPRDRAAVYKVSVREKGRCQLRGEGVRGWEVGRPTSALDVGRAHCQLLNPWEGWRAG